MFLYYDKNGCLLKEIIDKPFRLGNNSSNVIFVYIEGWKGTITSATLTIDYEDGSSSAAVFMTSDIASNGVDIFADGEFILDKDDVTTMNIFPFKWDYDYYKNIESNDGGLLKYTVGELSQGGYCVGSINISCNGENDDDIDFTLESFTFFVDYGIPSYSGDVDISNAIDAYRNILNTKADINNIVSIVYKAMSKYPGNKEIETIDESGNDLDVSYIFERL